MTLEDILARLEGVKKNGSGFIAKCPSHADSTPSLSVTEPDGRILLHCFANCATEDVLAKINLTMGDLFVNGHAAPRDVASYAYEDEEGTTLFEVVRYEPKDFRQRREASIGEVRPVL
jgi:putative DNA primase/helicase